MAIISKLLYQTVYMYVFELILNQILIVEKINELYDIFYHYTSSYIAKTF